MSHLSLGPVGVIYMPALIFC